MQQRPRFRGLFGCRKSGASHFFDSLSRGQRPRLCGRFAPPPPPSGPQRFPQPWRKRGAAAAAASRKGTRQSQGARGEDGLHRPALAPTLGPRGCDTRNAPGGAAAFCGRGAAAPRPAKPKPGPKAPALWALCAPAAPPPQGRSGSQKRQDKGRPSPLGKIYLSPDKRLFKIQLRRFVQGV